MSTGAHNAFTMTNRASASTPKTFANGLRRAEREIAKLAAGTDTDRALFMKAFKSLDHLSDCARYVTPETPEGWPCWLASEILSGQVSALRRAVSAAHESAINNAQAARMVEIRRLTAKMRDERPEPGTYRFELALMASR